MEISSVPESIVTQLHPAWVCSSRRSWQRRCRPGIDLCGSDSSNRSPSMTCTGWGVRAASTPAPHWCCNFPDAQPIALPGCNTEPASVGWFPDLCGVQNNIKHQDAVFNYRWDNVLIEFCGAIVSVSFKVFNYGIDWMWWLVGQYVNGNLTVTFAEFCCCCFINVISHFKSK